MSTFVKVKDVPKGQSFLLSGVPCIKASHNLLEINNGVECLTCFIQIDFTQNMVIAAESIIAYNDPEKRIGGECLIEIDV